VGLLGRRRGAGAEDTLAAAQAQLAGSDGVAGSALDQKQGSQLVAAAFAVGELGLVGLAFVAVVTQGGPVVDDQAPIVGGLLTPLPRQFVQGFGQARQVHTVVVQEAVGAQDGGEATGQFGQCQGMNAGGQGIAGV